MFLIAIIEEIAPFYTGSKYSFTTISKPFVLRPFICLSLQVFPPRPWVPPWHHEYHHTNGHGSRCRERAQRSRLVYICVQSGTRNRGQHIVATLWAVWCRTECQGHSRFPNSEVQGIRFCNHDKLWRGFDGDTKSERIRVGQPSAAGLLQDKQMQNIKAVHLVVFTHWKF